MAYIDAHIEQQLTAEALADVAGYSFHHFCHSFRNYTGVPVASYLRRRRLELAAADLLAGVSSLDAAISRGFATPSGFAKAFRKHYGVSPTEYRTIMKKGGIRMTPEIKKMAAFSAVGYRLAPPEGELDVLDASAYWLGKDFSAVSREEYAKLTYPGYAEIGAWMNPDRVSGEFYYFFGPIVKSKDYIPEGLTAIDVPEAEYAVFTVPAAESIQELNLNIRNTWKDIFNSWFDTSAYKFDEAGIGFEYYHGETTCIYIPVVKK